MDRRSLLAVVLSTAVILIFQLYLLPRPKPAPPKAVADSLAAVARAGHGNTPGTTLSTSPNGGAPQDSAGGAGRLTATPGLPDSTFSFDDPAHGATFATRGGGLTAWALKRYAGPVGQPVQLVRSRPEPHVTLDLGGEKVELDQVVFATDTRQVPGGRVVTFTSGAPGGLQVVKRFTLKDNDPVVGLDIEVHGVPVTAASPALEVGWLGGLPRAEKNQKLETAAITAVASVGQSIEKVQPARSKTASTKRFPGAVHWVGTHNKYFFAGILPPDNVATEAVLVGEPGTDPVAGAALRLPVAGTSATYALKLYLGPLSYTQLKPLGMDRAVDLGWKVILPLSRGLLSLMTWMHKLVPNYGWVIILLSILIKVAFYPMTISGMRSMREMQRIQPEMERIRKKYADDPQKMQQATMALYRDNKINPVGGCLPLLLQMPVFIALYPVLANSVELRQAPFLGWIRDLSAPDVLFQLPIASLEFRVLPILMAATMFWQQKLTPTNPSQAGMTVIMPVMMLFFLYGSPSGLTLYWTLLNVLSVIQQYLINRESPPTPVVATPTPVGRGGKAAKAGAR